MKKYLALILVVILSIVTACQSKETTGEETDVASDSADDKTLTIVYGSALSTPDPQGVSNAPRRAVDANVFNRLFRADSNMEIQPELVESYEQVDDTTLHIKLIEGIKFHNGDPLTAEDVKYSIERVALDESMIEYTFFKPISGVEVIDDYNLNVTTHEATPVLIDLLSKPASDILPSKYMEENGLDFFNENPVGSGPYKYVEWIKDDRVVLEPNEDYFKDVEFEWEQVIVRTIPESTTRVGELLTGSADIIDDVPPNEWERIEAEDGVSIVRGDSSRVILLIPKASPDSPLNDPKVREAIDYAINKEALAEDVLLGAGKPMRTRSPEGVFGSHPELASTSLYDPERAKELLAEAGYENGLEIDFQAPTDGYVLINDVAELIVQMLQEVGITVNYEQRQINSLIEDLQLGDNDGLSLIGYAHAYMDASYALSGYYSERGEKVTGWKSDKFDELYEAALSNLDDADREKQYQEMQEIVAEERPYIHLYQQLNNYGASDSIEFSPRIDEDIYLNEVKRK